SPRDSVVKQLDELYMNDRLPDTVICLYTGINQPNVSYYLLNFNLNN
ncbi:unnamed protein product, partial [Rotaria magnacalcarata]